MRPPPADPTCPPALDSLSVTFRNPDERRDYASRNPDFIPWLESVVRHVQETGSNAAELYKLVANFIADEDPNRSIICEQTPFLDLVRSSITNPPTSQETLKPLLACIMNLVLSSTYLVPHAALLPSYPSLISLANALHIPAAPLNTTTGETEEDAQVKATLVSWIWQSVLRILEATTTATPPLPIPSADTQSIIHPLTHFSHPSTAGRNSTTMSADLTILECFVEVVVLLAGDPEGKGAWVREIEEGRAFLAFIEHGEVVDGWTADEDEDSDSEDEDERTAAVDVSGSGRPGEKKLGTIKARLMALLGDLCAEPGIRLFPASGVTPTSLGSTLGRWIRDEKREDLVWCGLLCLGNYITDDDRAQEIASDAQLITHLAHLLDSTNEETPPQQTHALFGLVRNLVLAPSAHDLKRRLAPRVLACVGRAGVFGRGRDLVGSVQGGAVGLMRLLCRGDETTARAVLADETTRRQIMDLWKRTDEQSIMIEIGRFLAVLCTSLARTAPQDAPAPLDALVSDDRTVSALAGLVSLGAQQEVLFAEGVLALALIAKTPTGARAVCDVFVTATPDPALQSLETYASSATAQPPILCNICILLFHLAQGRLRRGPEDEDDEAAARVRRVLDVISGREEVDESVRGALKTAQAAWR